MPTINHAGKDGIAPSEPGSNAKEISIKLARDKNKVHYKEMNTAVEGDLDINESELKKKLMLNAKGGKGAPGLIGRDGAPGYKGMDGCDATTFSDGTNGGPGGRGEDGQPGTHGGHGGHGANITIEIDEKDLGALLLIHPENAGGKGGVKGRHGQGGPGGRGGRGGSSLSWTETHISTEHVSHHDHHHSHPQTMTHSVTYTRSGGHDGSDGPPGNTPNFRLKHGSDGMPGILTVKVRNQSGFQTYHEFYQLTAGTVVKENGEQSNINEPGDTISLFYTIKNIAAMPSPNETVFIMASDDTHYSVKEPGQVMGAIASGETRTANAPLKVQIKPVANYGNATPYNQDVTIKPTAYNLEFSHNYPSFAMITTINTRFPVEISNDENEIICIGPDEKATILDIIENKSNKALGAKHNRKIQVKFSHAHQSEEQNQQFTIFSDHPMLVPYEIESLPANDCLERCVIVGFNNQAKFGTQLNFYTELYLQPIDRSEQYNLIQRVPHIIQLTPRYAPSGSGFTLLINNETTAEAIEYWQQLFSSITAKPVAIWNVCYEKDNPLEAKQLLQDSQYGTLVILNNAYHLKGAQQHFSNQLTAEKMMFLRQRYHTNILTVGEQPANLHPEEFYKHKMPPVLPSTIQKHASLSALMSNLLKTDDKDMGHMVAAPTPGCFSQVTSAEFARQVSSRLRQVFPTRAYSVVAKFDFVEITRIPHAKEDIIPNIVMSDIPEKITHPNQSHSLFSSEEIEKVVSPLDFTQKLNLLTHYGNQYHQLMARSIIQDLLAEQGQIRTAKTYGAWWQDLFRCYQHDFSLELKQLNELVKKLEELQSKNNSAAAMFAPSLIQIIAHVQHHAQQQTSFWSRLFHLFVPQIDEQVNRATQKLCKRGLRVLPTIISTTQDDVKKTLEKEKIMVDVEKQLNILQKPFKRSFSIADHCCFFSQESSNPHVEAAAKQLLKVLKGQALTDTLMKHKKALNSMELMPLFTTILNIRPELNHEGILLEDSLAKMKDRVSSVAFIGAKV